MNDAALRKPRITRAEAAKLLGTSYQNVRRLQRTGQLHSSPDRYGVHRFDRREVEALARRRGMRVGPSGELAARVFQLFKERRRFEDIVIETQQEPEMIRRLWREFTRGFAAIEHEMNDASPENEIAELDREIEAKRREI